MIQQTFWRVIVTSIIWLMLGGIAIAAVLNAGHNNLDVPAIAIPAMVMATIATGLIWRDGSGESFRNQQNTAFVGQGDEKAKRDHTQDDPRLALLMEMMDEKELHYFKERLKQRILDESYVTDDGEIAFNGVSLDEVLSEEARSSQYQQR